MIKGFREASTDDYGSLETSFVRKLDRDVASLQNGDSIYAFLCDEVGLNGKITKLKVIKGSTDESYSFNPEGTDHVYSLEIFRKRNVKFPSGYCINEVDAQLERILRAKQVIDDYCEYIGYSGISDFIENFESFKKDYPEKLL